LPPSQRIRGVLAPVVTPFKDDLSPDPQRLIKHCQWLLSQNCGLAVFGTNSEANSMSAEERMTLLDALIAGDGNAKELDFVAQISGIADVVERNGFDAVNFDFRQFRFDAKGQRGKNGKLVSRVESADIESRIARRPSA
jgi:hypothetical protein